jgi:hypothetical protein
MHKYTQKTNIFYSKYYVRKYQQLMSKNQNQDFGAGISNQDLFVKI